jgi:4-carboxymuconolactone decarboxylase
MPRLPYPDPKNVPEDVRKILAARPTRNVFRMLSHASSLTPGLMELTGAILYKAKLDPVLRELVILRVGHLCGSHYEVHQHRKISQAIGLKQEKIDGTARDADPALYDERELVVLQMAEQVVRKVKADDALFATATAALGYEQTMELVIIIGTYVMLAQVLENAEVELEEGGGPAQEDVAKVFGSQARSR